MPSPFTIYLPQHSYYPVARHPKTQARYVEYVWSEECNCHNCIAWFKKAIEEVGQRVLFSCEGCNAVYYKALLDGRQLKGAPPSLAWQTHVCRLCGGYLMSDDPARVKAALKWRWHQMIYSNLLYPESGK